MLRIVRLRQVCFSLTWMMAGSALAQSRIPQFEDYPVTDTFPGQSAAPVFTNSQQRLYRTRIRDGVALGRGVWTGSWRDAKERPGPNFAGRYIVIRWGCGSDCLMMAIVDARTGRIYAPPFSGAGTVFFVPMDPMSGKEIEFRLDSSLMVLRNACAGARRQCGEYYFNWTNHRFTLVYTVPADLAKSGPDH
jgi:hypothetical protein